MTEIKSDMENLQEKQKKTLFLLNLFAGIVHSILFLVFFIVSISYWGEGREFKGIDTSTYVTQPVYSLRDSSPDEKNTPNSDGTPVNLEFFRADQVSETSDKVIPLLCCLFVLITALFHFNVAFWQKTKYYECLGSGTNPFRWIEYSITASIMFYIVLASLGMRDFNAILVAIPLCSIIMILGLFIEEYAHKSSKKDRYRALGLTAVAWLGFVALWSVLVTSFTRAIDGIEKARNPSGELSSDMEEFKTFLWLGFVIILAFYVSFGVWQTGNMFKTAGAYSREIGYISLSFCSKVLLVGLLFWGLYGRSSAESETDSQEKSA